MIKKVIFDIFGASIIFEGGLEGVGQ